jgi:Na+-driven multidrug efflux pump
LSEEGSKQYVGNQPKIKEFLKVLATLSAWCGVVLSIIAVLLSQQPQLFTKDPVLWPIMMSFKEYVGVLLPVLGIAQVLEGVLIGTDDLSFLSYSQIGNVILSFAALYVTKSMKMGVHGTWVVFMSFLLSRAIQASIRVFNTKKPWKTIKKA